MNSLAVVNGLSKSGGGASYAISAQCAALGRQGVKQILLNVQGPGDGEELLPDPAWVRLVTLRGYGLARPRIRWCPRFKPEARELCRRESIQLIHNHALWSPANHSAARLAAGMGMPLVTTPHGSLTRWAFGHKSWKKKWAWELYQKRDLELSKVVHVTAQEEAEDLRALGFEGPLALIPIGVDLPPWEVDPRTSSKEIRTALFFSRIHPKKGLLNLVEAWAAARPKGWRMRIVGPDESGHRQEVEKAVGEKGLEKEFVFEGPVYGDAKWEVYRDADLFILPTFSENFGIVVPEALACGVPVITTEGTPWKELNERACGWWIPLGVETLAQALRKALNLSDVERRQMGIRGRRLVEEKYTWSVSAKSMKALYAWILDGGTPPSFMMLD
jgi:glycosyltransferase involved in cell wall biosynthesis